MDPDREEEAFRRFRARLEAGAAAWEGEHPDRPAPPEWLAQTVSALFDGLEPGEADRWARRVHRELVRLDGRVPLAAEHDWQAGAVAPLLAGLREPGAGQTGTGVYEAVRRLHLRVLGGEPVGAEEWAETLEPAFREMYHAGYAHADAYATAYGDGHAYATTNDFAEDAAVEFADSYATLNATAAERAYAEANAAANARAVGAAYAAEDPWAYAATCPFARVNAYAAAHARRGAGAPPGEAGTAERRRDAYRRLAHGLLASVERAG